MTKRGKSNRRRQSRNGGIGDRPIGRTSLWRHRSLWLAVAVALTVVAWIIAGGFRANREGDRPALQGEPTTRPVWMKEQMAVAEQLTADYPDSADALDLLGLLNALQGRFDDAVECWERCLRLDQNRPVVYDRMGRVAMEKDDYERAEALLSTAIRLGPMLPGAHQRLAETLFNLGKPQEAVEILKEYLQTQPGDFTSHNLVGRAYLQMKQYDEAKRSYQAALDVKPDMYQAHYGLATCCVRLGETELAAKHFARFEELATVAREDDKASYLRNDEERQGAKWVAQTYIDATAIYRGYDRMKKAEDCLRRAAELDPNNTDCRLAMAGIHEQADRFRDALEAYRQALQIDPGHPLAYYRVGMLHARLGELDEAEKALRRANELQPGQVAGYRALAEVLMRAGEKLSEAQKLAQAVVGLQPAPDNYALLSEACRVSGDRAAAVAAIERAVSMQPDSVEFQMMLNSLREDK